MCVPSDPVICLWEPPSRCPCTGEHVHQGQRGWHSLGRTFCLPPCTFQYVDEVLLVCLFFGRAAWLLGS